MSSLVELYRHLHQTPELSLKEKETSARMAKELTDLGIDVTTNVGGYGVVGVLKNGSGKVLLLRSDMDALPVAEQTGLPYASKVHTEDAHGATVGVMHACGHDVHMTNLVGVAQYLASHRDKWSGTLVFVFQPAEEIGGGAEAMIKDGIFARFPRPDFAVAFHDSADVPTGEMNYFPGYALANVDSVDIVIKGRGGHGASPETTIDPIVIAAKLVLDLQTIVSREIKPIDPAVVTVGSIHAGTKHNIISDECRLQLTLRSLSPQVRKQLQDAVRRKALAAAASAGAPEPTVEISEGTPALFNDPQLTKRLATALKNQFGDDKIKEGEPVMGGEDFGRFGSTGVPLCMLRLGAVNQKRLDEFAAKHVPPSSLHSPLFYPDIEETLTLGVPAMVACVTELLPKK
ncbi:MAG TPA: amidohydrolase [Lacipirellulaceae bacterium]|nr:amidohydrolase [Lacipirellulaceae bacterium]